MAVELYDDYEQGERVKKWIKTNGSAVLLGLGIAVAGYFGFNYWQAQQQQQRFDAAQYHEVVGDQLALLTDDAAVAATINAEGETISSEPDDSVMFGALATLQNDYSDSLYAALATLQVADYKLGEDDLQGASQQYQFILDNSVEGEITAIAALRLARLQLAMQEPQAVLQTLNRIGAGSDHKALIARIRGEAYLAMDDREQALQAFSQAEEELGGTPDRMLELRLADLRDIDIEALLDNAEPLPNAPITSTPISTQPILLPQPQPAPNVTQEVPVDLAADTEVDGEQ